MKKRLGILSLVLVLILTGCSIGNNKKGISEKEAIKIALQEVGIKEKDTTMMRATREDAENDYAYTIEFHYGDNEYEYVVGSNGDIYRSERRSIGEASTTIDKETPTKSGFTEEDALNVALDHAGVSKTEAMLLKIERDIDDGQVVFEVEFRTPTSEYEYEISETGAVLESDRKAYRTGGDIVYTRPTYYYSGATRYYYSGATRYIDPSMAISDQEAINIAMTHAGVKESEANIIKFKRDNSEFDIDFIHGQYKYQYEVSLDGVVLKSKKKLYR